MITEKDIDAALEGLERCVQRWEDGQDGSLYNHEIKNIRFALRFTKKCLGEPGEEIVEAMAIVS